MQLKYTHSEELLLCTTYYLGVSPSESEKDSVKLQPKVSAGVFTDGATYNENEREPCYSWKKFTF